MAISQTDIDALERALMSGELSVEIDGRKVVYRSVADLREALAYAREQIAGASAEGPVSVSYASFGRD